MTHSEAYRIMGLPEDADMDLIRKRYRELMLLVHPDARQNQALQTRRQRSGKSLSSFVNAKRMDHEDLPDARMINLAYSTLQRSRSNALHKSPKEKQEEGRKRNSGRQGGPAGLSRQSTGKWDAPCNPSAYCERNIYCHAEDMEGNPLGIFPVAKGKYLWTLDEDFSLFQKSLLHCAIGLLGGKGTGLSALAGSPGLMQAVTSLSFLLAQQFTDSMSMLRALAVNVTPPDGTDADSGTKAETWVLPAMLEYDRDAMTRRADLLGEGVLLYPAELRAHRLFLKNKLGHILGYLSFQDDRLYYVVIPLFEQKAVRVRIRTAGMPTLHGRGKNRTACQKLELFLQKSPSGAGTLPENLNLQIEGILAQYHRHFEGSSGRLHHERPDGTGE